MRSVSRRFRSFSLPGWHSKRSGDIYTQTDYVLLGAIAEPVSHELGRFTAEEVHRAVHVMQSSCAAVPEPRP
jgi:hypothetical protein